jgi:hypothetical protein
MNLLHVCIVACLILGGSICRAQSAGAADDLPAAPWVLPAAPDFAKWSIEYRYADTGNSRAKVHADAVARIKAMSNADPVYGKAMANNPGLLLAMDPPPLQQVAIVKTKNLRQEKLVYEGGYTGERWNDGIAELNLLPGAKSITVDLVGGDPSTQDFQEFSWLARGNFKSRLKDSGKDYLIFQQSMPALQITNPRLYNGLRASDPASEQVTTKVPITAIVDAATKLPVSLQVGSEFHLYSFLPASPDMLVMEPEFAQAAQQTEERYRAMNRPRPLP